MSHSLFIVGIILSVIFVDLSNGLSCLPCNKSNCKKPQCEPEYQIKDLCGCCDICGGTFGDSCSGFRQCAKGFWCIEIKGDVATAKKNMVWHDPTRGVCGTLSTTDTDTDYCE